jgi:non-homologous end joining protein Ku
LERHERTKTSSHRATNGAVAFVCPSAVYAEMNREISGPAASDTEAFTVANEDIVKGYLLDKDTCLAVTRGELENIALESTRTLEIDEFVKREEIDPRYQVRPY